MYINQDMLREHPDLWQYLLSNNPQLNWSNFKDKSFCFKHVNEDKGCEFTIFEVIASQGLINYAEYALDNSLPQLKQDILHNMLACAIKNNKYNIINFCVNHEDFDDSIIGEKIFLLTALHGPFEFFQQLIKHFCSENDVADRKLVRSAIAAMNNGQRDILQLIFEFDEKILDMIVNNLVNRRVENPSILKGVFENQQTEILQYLLSIPKVQDIVPNLVIYWTNYALICKHSAAVKLFLKWPDIVNYLIPPGLQAIHDVLRNAAVNGDPKIFEALLSFPKLKARLYHNYSNHLHLYPDLYSENVWDLAIVNGNFSLLQIIYENSSDLEQQNLRTNTIRLLEAITYPKMDAKILNYLLSFPELKEHFYEVDFPRYMKNLLEFAYPNSGYRYSLQRLKLCNYVMSLPNVLEKFKASSDLQLLFVEFYGILKLDLNAQINLGRVFPLTDLAEFNSMFHRAKELLPNLTIDFSIFDKAKRERCKHLTINKLSGFASNHWSAHRLLRYLPYIHQKPDLGYFDVKKRKVAAIINQDGIEPENKRPYAPSR